MSNSSQANESLEYIDRAIESITKQIELLSNRCILEDNKKNVDFQNIIEVTSLMLQLSRTLNELLVTKKFLQNDDHNPAEFLHSILNGRKI